MLLSKQKQDIDSPSDFSTQIYIMLAKSIGIVAMALIALSLTTLSEVRALGSPTFESSLTDKYMGPIVSPSEQSETEQTEMFIPLFQSVRSHAFCRFGVNLNTQGTEADRNLDNYDVRSLNLGWYINYSATPSYTSSRVEHAPMIRLTQPTTTTYSYTPAAARIARIAEDNPGADWFISNEPDRKEYQDSVLPNVYATAYNELYYLIKELDPNAQIFAGSIVQPTVVRLQYLDLILESYQDQFNEPMPVDGWSIHNFILNEASCDHYNNNLSICWGADMPPAIDAVDGLRIGIDQHHDIELFKQQIVRFRNWMKDNGYRDKPVYLSEYGVLLPDWYRPTVDFGPDRINEFMTASFDYILSASEPELGDPADNNRLVQRLSWYSVNDDYRSGSPYIYNGNLFSPATYQRSRMGDNYAEYTSSLAPEIDIAPVSLSATATNTHGVDNTIVLTGTSGITGTVDQNVVLEATVSNSGNLIDHSRTFVTFFDGDPNNGGTIIGERQPISLNGCGDRANVQVQWSDVPTGQYSIFIQTDRENLLTETNEMNNLYEMEIIVAQGTVIIP